MVHLEVLGENGEHGAPKDPSREGNGTGVSSQRPHSSKASEGPLKGHGQSRTSSDRGVSREEPSAGAGGWTGGWGGQRGSDGPLESGHWRAKHPDRPTRVGAAPITEPLSPPSTVSVASSNPPPEPTHRTKAGDWWIKK